MYDVNGGSWVRNLRDIAIGNVIELVYTGIKIAIGSKEMHCSLVLRLTKVLLHI